MLLAFFWGAFSRSQPDDYAKNMIELFEWHQKGLVKPLIEEHFNLSKAAIVLEKILSRGAKGKVILNP